MCRKKIKKRKEKNWNNKRLLLSVLNEGQEHRLKGSSLAHPPGNDSSHTSHTDNELIHPECGACV